MNGAAGPSKRQSRLKRTAVWAKAGVHARTAAASASASPAIGLLGARRTATSIRNSSGMARKDENAAAWNGRDVA